MFKPNIGREQKHCEVCLKTPSALWTVTEVGAVFCCNILWTTSHPLDLSRKAQNSHFANSMKLVGLLNIIIGYNKSDSFAPRTRCPTAPESGIVRADCENLHSLNYSSNSASLNGLKLGFFAASWSKLTKRLKLHPSYIHLNFYQDIFPVR